LDSADPKSGILLALRAGVGTIWISDRDPGIRQLFAELMPEAAVLTPDELVGRLRSGDRPAALVIDGTQLLELSAARRRELLRLPRTLICTGLALTSIPMDVVAGPGVAVLAKPFCVEDLETAVAWLREVGDDADDRLALPMAAMLTRTAAERDGDPLR
jgi:hypothetical protein